MADPVTIELEHPIEFGSKTIAELTFRPIKAKDLRRVKAPDHRRIEMTLELAGYLSGQPTQVIDELEGNDLMKVLDLVADFLSGSPATGVES